MKKQRSTILKWSFLAVFLLVAGCFYSCGGTGTSTVAIFHQDGKAFDAETAPRTEKKVDGGPTEENFSETNSAADREELDETKLQVMEQSTESLCYVYVCGEVFTPGVYQLPENARIFEAVEQAGGFTPEAAESWLNLAETISDGMKLEVPSKTQVADSDWLQKHDSKTQVGKAGEVGTGTALVNINTASVQELTTLKGIGASRAEDIIRYREEAGGFTKIEDIMKVPGIKQAAFQKIKENITV